MPKDPIHLSKIQNQRLKNKQKLSKFVPGKVTLQVLGTGAKGAPRSLYVFTDQTRYLFNCGEGTQRLAHELKLKLSKLEHIFITHPVWQNLGGLPGLSLTMQDVGVPFYTIHGPAGLPEMFDAAKKFVVLKNLKIQTADSNPKKVFEDNVMKVQYVVLNRHLEMIPDEFPEDEPRKDIDEIVLKTQMGINIDVQVDEGTSTGKNKRSRSISSYLSEENNSSTSSSSGKSRKRRRRKKNRTRSLSLETSPPSRPWDKNPFFVTKDKEISMCYICRLQPRPGALSLDRCVDLGVPPGPLLGKLKSGEDVVLKNGDIVRSEQVCDPDDPGPIFIVVDCPTEEYITSLVSNESFKQYQQFDANDGEEASVVVHFSPKRVMDDPRYKAWMDLFIPSTQHLILNETNSCMGSMSVHRIQYKLNMIHPEIFPILGDNGTEIDNEEAVLEENEDSSQNNRNRERNLYANTLTSIHLRPRKGLDRTGEVKLRPKEYIDESMRIEGLPTALHDLRTILRSEESTFLLEEYPKVLFLGTGSCIPNKTRNTSGILLETGPDRKVLLDCGEGTYGQIVRFYGKHKCDEILSAIDSIYVSHLHADHHIGIIGLLQGRRRALNKLKKVQRPVVLMAPLQLFTWLSFYDRYFERIRGDFEFISNHDLVYTSHGLNNVTYNRILNTLQMKEINTCLVKHCPNAFGVSFTLADGAKVTYSGDTMPCSELVTLGKESDLLIHEATMEDDLEREAVIKMHSTTSQAIEIGRKMGAKNVLLTHFSQRYAKLPRFNESFAENVGIAFDNMQVRLGDLPLLPSFNPILKLLFSEHYDEMEQKAMKRQLRQEKENELHEDKQKIQKIQ